MVVDVVSADRYVNCGNLGLWTVYDSHGASAIVAARKSNACVENFIFLNDR